MKFSHMFIIILSSLFIGCGEKIENPDLIQRPIVKKGDRAILARPPEKITELIK